MEPKKNNFAGGEPTLSPFLKDLIIYSKGLGLPTRIISNGTGINMRFLKKISRCLDWVGLSLDSGNELIQYYLGRGNGTYVKEIIEKCEMIKNEGIKLKINSVITKLNYREDMSWFIEKICPDRWITFQVLEIKGQNSNTIKDLKIKQKEFYFFIKRHKFLNPMIENDEKMFNSYLMIDPKGRFYQNNGKVYNFSHSILEIGINKSLNEIKFDPLKFLDRGGFYEW